MLQDLYFTHEYVHRDYDDFEYYVLEKPLNNSSIDIDNELIKVEDLFSAQTVNDYVNNENSFLLECHEGCLQDDYLIYDGIKDLYVICQECALTICSSAFRIFVTKNSAISDNYWYENIDVEYDDDDYEEEA